MKKFMFIILVFGSTSTYACWDMQSVGDNLSTDQIGLENTDNYREDNKNRNGNSYDLNGCNDDEEEQSKITVYGYAPNFGGFGGMVGINFALSYSGSGGGYIGTTTDDVSCDNEDLTWANNAFKEYVKQYKAEHGFLAYADDHPTGTLWTVELPSGEEAVYVIVNPHGGVALGNHYVSCS